MSLDFNKLVNQFFQKMKEYHDKSCDYPCFTVEDVERLLPLYLKGERLVEKHEGTTVIDVTGQIWGNVSWDHFISALHFAKALINRGDI